MPVSKLLLDAKRKFRGQTAKVDATGFNNSPIPNGKYMAKIVESTVRDREIKVKDETGETIKQTAPVLYMYLKILTGEAKGRNVFPFCPRLDQIEGITNAARNLRVILGDKIPGKEANGEFVLDAAGFLDEVEGLAKSAIGEVVEITVKDSKKTRDDGTFFQSVYINRGLGEDGKAYLEGDKAAGPTAKRETRAAGGSMARSGLPPAARRRAAR